VTGPAVLVTVVDTPSGPAVVHRTGPAGAPLLVLGHGAGGGPGALTTPDLRSAAAAAEELGWAWALVQQPWHVAGRRVAEAPGRLDAAWLAVLARLERTVVVGGRSAGARVACRTSTASGAAGVLALAFPLTPRGRPGRSRADELALPRAPVQVVQGSRDAFGVPEPATGRRVHVVAGADHGFRVRVRDGRSPAEVERELQAVVRGFLCGVDPRGPGKKPAPG